MTSTVVGWIDVFSKQVYRQIVIDSLSHCIRLKGLNVYAYCLMSNHLHMIVNANEPFQLEDIIRDFKKYTAKRILIEIETGTESRKEWMLKYFKDEASKSKRYKNYKFWQTGNHAIELYNEKFTWDKINYIHQNPVKAGLVKNPEDWIYSSMSNYMDMESVIPEVVCLSQRLKTY